jgi:hypothetical protein
MKKRYTTMLITLALPMFVIGQIRNDAGLQGDAGATSGFFETNTPTNYPTGAIGWWHLLDVRHSNPSNNLAMQFSGSFYDQELYFRKTNNNAAGPWSKVLLETGGRVGIGINNPDFKLDVNGTINATGKSWFSYGSNISGYSWTDAALTTNSIEIVNNNATVSNSSPTLAFHRHGSGGPQFRLAADGTNILYLESSGANSSRSPLPYGAGPNSYFQRFHIDAGLSTTGDVSIGTSDTKGYKLAVNGKIRAQEIKVEATPWPDYVFDKSYQLPTLLETEKHIKEKGHLPGIPSAAEVKANGIDLGEMNAKLLQKIEELTLIIIDLNKRSLKQSEELKDHKKLIEQFINNKK